jgi:ubiquinone/menaquinone biosynthesis C-methylase UbiE
MNEGLFYFSLIDPLLKKLHNRVAEEVPEGASVIDIACGNGTLPMKYAVKASQVTAIDLAAGKLAFARRMAARRGITNITFIEMDAVDLSRFPDGEFDIATVSMAIHQFRPETGIALLKALQRIANKVLIADYHYPLPGGFSGSITRLIEWMAGKEHNSCFHAYLSNGGLPGISALVYPDDPVFIQPAGSVFSVATIG